MARATQAPERLTAAVARLEAGPGARVLEVGCGRGVAAGLVVEGAGRGTYVGVDRSAVAIAAAGARNAAHVAAGRARFLAQPLADLSLGDERFDLAFAVNVNCFWLGAERELAAVARHLAPAGRLFLFYEPPAGDRCEPIAARLRARLAAARFAVERVDVAELSRSRLLTVVASGRPLR